MSKIKFGVCEFGFPCWGPSAIRMAHEAGFEGIQLADCGGTDKSYPLTNKWIQEDYLSTLRKNMGSPFSPFIFTLWCARVISEAACAHKKERSPWKA